MSCGCDKPTGSVGRMVWRVAVVVALLASPDVRKLATSLLTSLTQQAISSVAQVQTRHIEAAEEEARRVAARQAELQALREHASAAERNGVDRELADADAESLAARVALGEGLRSLKGIRDAAEAITNQIARSRGYEPQDRLAQATKLREARAAALAAAQREDEHRAASARLAAEARREAARAAALEAEVEKTGAAAHEASRSLAAARREAEQARREADELRTELVSRRVAAARAAEVSETPCCSQSEKSTGKTDSRRVATSSYRVRTEAGE